MPNHTRGRWSQDSPNTDAQMFFGAGNFSFFGTTPAIATNGSDPYNAYYNLNGGGVTYSCFLNLQCLLRTGMYATPNDSQEQFGTAALQPGPSSVANTSDPLAISGYPPFANAKNPIFGGSVGPVAKGTQINWVDVIYATGANALGGAQLGLATVKYANNVAPTAVDIITFGTNGLPTTAQINPFRKRVAVTNPAFIISDGTSLILLLSLTTGATATTTLYGVVVGYSFNFN